eukprot:TRINITY_DN17438_c0_g1_i1.p1 TRINITY_DN17438_c0_g1~~TRINITY_DN17438_c0_g1_i1.p1  ORF type:complete len:329 (-),score=63.39 TRINITY_DN17438_c0_g1_i1:63-1025(-)
MAQQQNNPQNPSGPNPPLNKQNSQFASGNQPPLYQPNQPFPPQNFQYPPPNYGQPPQPFYNNQQPQYFNTGQGYPPQPFYGQGFNPQMGYGGGGMPPGPGFGSIPPQPQYGTGIAAQPGYGSGVPPPNFGGPQGYPPPNPAYQSGYSSMPPMPPAQWVEQNYGRATSDEQFILEEWFKSVDQDHSGAIEEAELAAALAASGDSFSRETTKLMVEMFDRDHNGTIDFNEFTYLFKYIQSVRESFDQADLNKKGKLDANGVERALQNARLGLTDSRSSLPKLMRRFDKRNTGYMTFEQFLQTAILLATLRSKHNKPDVDRYL